MDHSALFAVAETPLLSQLYNIIKEVEFECEWRRNSRVRGNDAKVWQAVAGCA